jgi:hypothetical protein
MDQLVWPAQHQRLFCYSNKAGLNRIAVHMTATNPSVPEPKKEAAVGAEKRKGVLSCS